MSFGRKGLDLASAPASVAIQPSAEQPPIREDRGGFAFGRLALTLVVIVIGVLTVEGLFAGSALITPLPDGVALYVTLTGAALGLVGGVYAWLFSDRIDKGWRATVGLFLGAPLLAGGWANMVMWQLADDVSFAFSGAAWESKRYPVTGFDRPGRRTGPFGRYSVEIDPFDAGDTDIPIPDEQYAQLAGSAEGLCVTVQQRRSPSGAIEVATDGTLNLSAPAPAAIGPC